MATSGFNVGDKVVVITDTRTPVITINKGSTGEIVATSNTHPWIHVRINHVNGIFPEGEITAFYPSQLRLVNISHPKPTGPDEKELRRRRDEQLARIFGF